MHKRLSLAVRMPVRTAMVGELFEDSVGCFEAFLELPVLVVVEDLLEEPRFLQRQRARGRDAGGRHCESEDDSEESESGEKGRDEGGRQGSHSQNLL